MHFPTFTKMTRQPVTRRILHREEIMSSYSCFQSPSPQTLGRTGIYTVPSTGRKKTSVVLYYARSSRRGIGRLQSSKVVGCGGQAIVVGSVERDRIWRRLITGFISCTKRTQNVRGVGVFVLDLIPVPRLEAQRPPWSWRTALWEDVCGEDQMLPIGEGRRLRREQEFKNFRLLGRGLQLPKFLPHWSERTASVVSLLVTVNGLQLL